MNLIELLEAFPDRAARPRCGVTDDPLRRSRPDGRFYWICRAQFVFKVRRW
jgi:hypothetical protein